MGAMSLTGLQPQHRQLLPPPLGSVRTVNPSVGSRSRSVAASWRPWSGLPVVCAYDAQNSSRGPCGRPATDTGSDVSEQERVRQARDSVLFSPSSSQRATNGGGGVGSTAHAVAAEAAAAEATVTKPLDAEEFREHAHRMVDFIADYYRDIESLRVRSNVEPGYLSPLLPPSPPQHPEPLDAILDDVRSKILPGVTHWQSPRFFAYFPANSSTAGLLGDMLGGALNVIGFNWIASPAATELETLVLDWLAQLLQLPSAFMSRESGGVGGGVIQGTASEAVLVALLAARERELHQISPSPPSPSAQLPSSPSTPGGSNGAGRSSSTPSTPSSTAVGSGSHAGALDRLVGFTSDQAHSCVLKAWRVAGLKESNLRVLPTTAETEFALCPKVLEAAVQEVVAEGLKPFFISATVGTTSSGAVDPLDAIGLIAQAHGAWLHVDAAYAGSACICPEFRGYLDGVERADSLCMNAHKWLLTNFDCSCMWVKDSAALVNALSGQPEFLRNKPSDKGLVVDYKDWQVPLGRRFRSLKLWFVLRMYGAAGLQSYIRNHVSLAKFFEEQVREDPRFEVAAVRRFALVCFRLRTEDGDGGRAVNERLLEDVNSSGVAFLTHTVLGGKYVLRMAIGASLTEKRHVEEAWAAIQHAADKVV